MSYNDKYIESRAKCQEILDGFKSKSKISPQVGKGHFGVMIEVHIIEALTNVHWIHGSTLPFVLVVLRKTWGYNKNKVWAFSYKDKASCRGIKSLLPPTVDERTIIRSVNEAVSRNIIVAIKENGRISTYGFNKHYDTWIYDKEMEGKYQYVPVKGGDIDDSGDTGDSGDTEVGGDTEVSGDTGDSGDTEVGGINKEMVDILTS